MESIEQIMEQKQKLEVFQKQQRRLSDEDMDSLYDQLRELQDNNGRLFKLLSEKDFEIQQLKKNNEELQLAGAGCPGLFGATDATNIVALSKENQQLQAAFEQEKIKSKLLSDRVRELEREDNNGRLFKLLSEKDFEIQQLKKKNNEELQLAGAGCPGLFRATAATKIVELSKNNQQLQAAFEQEKIKSKRHSDRVRELEREVVSGQKTNSRSHTTEDSQDTHTGKSLKDKLVAANLKVAEYRNQIQSCKQELKVAHKVLASEFGKDVNIHQLLKCPGSFRTHFQQTLALQQRVKDLEQQLEVRNTSPQDKNHSHLHTIEKKKRSEMQRLLENNEMLFKEQEGMKKKLEASKARNTSLTTEVKALKEQISSLLDKSQHDDELVQTLLMLCFRVCPALRGSQMVSRLLCERV
ncbi:coiled-coil domain-containing protein 13-like isoform X2 [Gouania willdenowi]|uniref:coiled-coil domain-containing protein 13-like isoform X2 n=1 Tax=Gouania willdenowi TaxID=441366 RepID=UPI001056AB79|nr:coiled-coil domain-containing protein 13-like isoform X2 [Gouania willdenowi]